MHMKMKQFAHMKMLLFSCMLVLLSLGWNARAIPVINVAQGNQFALQTDQKIVVTGTATISGVHYLLLIRYNTNGSFDTAFGTGGIVLLNLGTETYGRSVAIQADGNIVATGFTVISGVSNLFITRHLATNGSLDTTFAASGIYTNTINTGASGLDITLDASQNIVVCGTSNTQGTNDIFVARLTSAGVLDTTFNATGIVETLVGNISQPYALVIQSDGKIVVAGYGSQNNLNQALLVRYNNNGSYDSSFGTSGIVQTTLGTEQSRFRDVKLQADGKILACGFQDNTFLLARFNDSDGSFDTSFGTGGVVTTFYGVNSFGSRIAVQANGKILAIGTAYNNNLTQYVVARYTQPSGALDTATFGISGIVAGPFIPSLTTSSILQQADTKILALGYLPDGVKTIRLLSFGLPDINFAEHGVIVQPKSYLGGSTGTCLWEQQTSSTDGGTFTSGSWQTRALNNIKGDIENVTLSSNQFTLQSGTYYIYASAPAFGVGKHQIRLQNVSDNITEMYGTSSYSGCGALGYAAINNAAELTHTMFLLQAKTFEIQHQCEVTQAANGFGVAAGFASNFEVYTRVQIYKIESINFRANS